MSSTQSSPEVADRSMDALRALPAPQVEGWTAMEDVTADGDRCIRYRHNERGLRATVSIIPFTERERESSGYTPEQWAQWPWDVAVYGDEPEHDGGTSILPGYGQWSFVVERVREALQVYLEAHPDYNNP